MFQTTTKNLQKLASCRWPGSHGKAPRAQKHRCPQKKRSQHTQRAMVDFSERPSPYQMPTRSPEDHKMKPQVHIFQFKYFTFITIIIWAPLILCHSVFLTRRNSLQEKIRDKIVFCKSRLIIPQN